jgi:UDP-N-acetylmuramoyl-tripeptide--D-alanyl-D-alanine ligase
MKDVMKTDKVPSNSHWKMSIEELVAGAEGYITSSKQREFCGVGTDTRVDLSGKIFVALQGENYDAHDYLPQAVASGAAALLVHRIPENAQDLVGQVTIVEVKDTLKSFQLLANFWRHKMRPRVIGITGTNGKTTTKEFAATLIGSKRKVQYSKGSFNNHWGVPMSLLAIDSTHEVAIVEMGMNHPGELTELDAIAEPDVVVCTMVGRGHLEGLGTIEGVAKAKAEIYEHAPKSSMRIFNLENEQTRKMFETMSPSIPKSQVMTFASAHFENKDQTQWPDLDVAFEVVEVLEESLKIRGEIQGVRGETSIGVFGRQNLNNLMVASCCALASGLSPAEVWAALPLCKTAWGRNQWVKLQGGGRVLFDGYNANPESMTAAIENFASLKPAGRKFAVLGEMLELGSSAGELHREMGEKAAQAGFDGVSFFGPHAQEFSEGLASGGFSKSLFVSNSYEQSLAPKTLPVLNDNDIVLIKGSRGMKLEKVLADLKPISFEEKK